MFGLEENKGKQYNITLLRRALGGNQSTEAVYNVVSSVVSEEIGPSTVWLSTEPVSSSRSSRPAGSSADCCCGRR